MTDTALTILERRVKCLNKKDFRSKTLILNEEMRKLDGAVTNLDQNLTHQFTPHMYIRTITMPKGMVVVTKIHKTEHPYFILKGDVSVLTEEGTVRIKAPYQGITKAGTIRIIYNHEETVWVTVHSTDLTDVDEIVDDITATDFKEIERMEDEYERATKEIE